jgi:hypothetical protein
MSTSWKVILALNMIDLKSLPQCVSAGYGVINPSARLAAKGYHYQFVFARNAKLTSRADGAT